MITPRPCGSYKCIHVETDRITRTSTSVSSPLTQQVIFLAEADNKIVQWEILYMTWNPPQHLSQQTGKLFRLFFHDRFKYANRIREFGRVVEIQNIGRPEIARFENALKPFSRRIMIQRSVVCIIGNCSNFVSNKIHKRREDKSSSLF